MALTFNGSTDILSWTGQLFTAYPCAIFGWAKPTSAGTNQMACAAGDPGGPDEIAAYFQGGSSGCVLGYDKAAGSANPATSTSSIVTSWQPFMVALTASGNTVTVYYASGAPVAGSCTPITLANLTKFVVGNWAESTALPFAGDLAEFAAWQGTIPTSGDFTSMAGGTKPETIQPGTLVDSWSLLTFNASSQVGTVSRTLTVTGTSQAAVHPITRTGGSANLFRTNPSGNLSGLGSSGPFFQNPLQ